MEFEFAESPQAVADNIRAYQEELRASAELRRRVRYHQSWYAVRGKGGGWLFGPSKFVGYAGIDGDNYVETAVERNGRVTEAHLRKWFVVVEEGDALRGELAGALQAFLAEHGLTPRAQTRINILPADVKRTATLVQRQTAPGDDDLVDLLIRVAHGLSADDRARVRAAL